MSSPLGPSIVQELHIGNVSYTANSMSTTAAISENTILLDGKSTSIEFGSTNHLWIAVSGRTSNA